MIRIVRRGALNFLKKGKQLKKLMLMTIGKSYMEIRFYKTEHTIGQLKLIIIHRNILI